MADTVLALFLLGGYFGAVIGIAAGLAKARPLPPKDRR